MTFEAVNGAEYNSKNLTFNRSGSAQSQQNLNFGEIAGSSCFDYKLSNQTSNGILNDKESLNQSLAKNSGHLKLNHSKSNSFRPELSELHLGNIKEGSQGIPMDYKLSDSLETLRTRLNQKTQQNSRNQPLLTQRELAGLEYSSPCCKLERIESLGSEKDSGQKISSQNLHPQLVAKFNPENDGVLRNSRT